MEPVSVSTHIRELRKFPACFINFVKKLVRTVGVVLSYIPPDFVKIVLSLGALVDSQYQSFALFCCACKICSLVLAWESPHLAWKHHYCPGIGKDEFCLHNPLPPAIMNYPAACCGIVHSKSKKGAHH